MLQVNGISKRFGDQVILQDVSFTLNAGERAGLVGPNGCGKTTLLRIIAGEEAADAGSVHTAPAGVRTGYLAQALAAGPEDTVGTLLRRSAGGLAEAEQAVAALAAQMAAAAGPELARLGEAYDRALARLEAAGAATTAEPPEAILAGLGLDGVDRDTPVAHLSGGLKTRLGLACLLQTRPRLLLLDEPTNHLDLDALAWLEAFVGTYDGAVIVVSHDRTFLDRTVTAILALDPHSHTLTAYPGTYSDFVQARARERENQQAAYQDQQERVARLQGEIRGLSGHARRIEQETTHYHYRKIAKGLARRAVVQRRRLERLLAGEERVERPQRSWQMHLAFEGTPQSGRDVVMVEEADLGYDGRPLLSGVSLTLRRGERVALVGPNGSGKTTLLRAIAGELAPITGTVRLGSGVVPGLMAQEQETLGTGEHPLAVIQQATAWGETEARRFLHLFLFGGDDAFAPLERLSYGERARLALARLVAGGCNLLLLDEPINHLDIASRDRFEQGLAAFDGTVLAVVHDRHFVAHFATAVWSVERGGVRRYVDLEDRARGRLT